MSYRSVSAICVFLVLHGCGSETAQDKTASEVISDTVAIHATRDYLGSSSCADCHEPEYESWRGSHHELAMQLANESTVLADFTNTEFDYYGKNSLFTTQEDGYYVRTENENGEDQDYRITHTFGVEPLQQYLVEFPGGRLQALPYAWDTRPADAGGQRWYHLYPDEYIAPDDELHWTGRLQNWNYMCAECHSTNLVMGYDYDTKTYNTTYSELSVGCEACHGPGSKHVEQASAGDFDEGFGLPVALNDRAHSHWQMNPDTGIAELVGDKPSVTQQPETCGRCHSRRGVATDEYEHGKLLADTHTLSLLHEPLYFADGQIRDEVFVYGSFVQSRMHQAGVTCSDCHDSHSGELKLGGEPSDVCAQCHLPTKFATFEHSGHETADAACVDCHMTSRTYMGVDDRRDHSFRVPRPDLTVSVGTPNACNGCHTDQDAKWATEEIRKVRPSDWQPRSHIATPIAASLAGDADGALALAAQDSSFPEIQRASALALLVPPFGEVETQAIASGLSHRDPLLRIAALRALRPATAETRMSMGAEALYDPVLTVRLAAVPVYADVRDLLPRDSARAFNSAASEFRASSLMLSNTPEALANLANFELSMGDQDRATELYREALVLAPTFAEMRHALGLILIRSGERDEALVQLGQAYELAPGNARYVYVYGVALNSMGFSEDALELLQAAYAKFPEDFDIGWATATMLRDAGELDGARQVAEDLARKFPENTNVLALLRSLR